MKNIFQIIRSIIRFLIKITPFFLGFYSYYPYFVKKETTVYPILDTLYASFKLYCGVTESGVKLTMALEVARFLALAITLSLILNVISKVKMIRLLRPDSTVVYGDSFYADHMYKSLSMGCRIRGKDKFISNAGRYVLMLRSDSENLRFYSDNYERLKNKRTYIMLENISRQDIGNKNVMVFSISENCAREFWRDYPPESSEKIGIIGFSNVGKNVLLYGLQHNIIDPAQHFAYHIFGDASEFRRLHTELDQMAPDEIIFHDDGIYTIDEIVNFDRLILCGEENENINVLSNLKAAAAECPDVYVYALNGDIITNLFGKEKIHCFGTAETTAAAEMIFSEKAMKAAKQQHEYYVNKYGGDPWEKLDAFKRYSNVSSADYLTVIKRLKEKNVPDEVLAELEHMRWCRYHYINNWKYGKQRDNSRRIHNSLVPFSQLSPEERQKDVEAISSKIDEEASE